MTAVAWVVFALCCSIGIAVTVGIIAWIIGEARDGKTQDSQNLARAVLLVLSICLFVAALCWSGSVVLPSD